MEEALMALLLGHAPLQAIVADRVHWMRKPRSVAGFPYVNLQVISDPRSYHMKGESSLRRTRVQADLWGETYSSVEHAQRALTSFLSGYSGAQGGVNFQGIFVGGERDLSDTSTGEERQLFRISVDLEISWNKET